jgi:hypothetical protein
MTPTMKEIDVEVSTTSNLGRSALPPALAAAVDLLKVGSSLLQALGTIEQLAWEEHIHAAESRANAFGISAMVYGDLSQSEWDNLDKHIRERVAARRKLLQEMFSDSATDNHS